MCNNIRLNKTVQIIKDITCIFIIVKITIVFGTVFKCMFPLSFTAIDKKCETKCTTLFVNKKFKTYLIFSIDSGYYFVVGLQLIRF